MAEKTSEKKPNVFSRIGKFFRDTKSEIKKIVWPTPKAATKNLGIVLAMIVIIGLIVYGLDSGLYALLGLIMKM